MASVIKLGLAGAALSDYTLEQQGDGIAWERGPANPFAARVNSSGKYDEVDIWNEWAQEDWQTGVGRVDPEEGGFLYAEAETRVPMQVILPPLVQQCDTRTANGTTADCRFMDPNTIDPVVTIAASQKGAMAFTMPDPIPSGPILFMFLCRATAGETIRLSIYSDLAGSPDISIATNTFTATAPDRTYRWQGCALPNNGAAGALYWLVIETAVGTSGVEVVCSSFGYNIAGKRHNGSAWVALSGTNYLLYRSSLFPLCPTSVGLTSAGFIRFNGSLYSFNEDVLYKYDSANERFDLVGTITDSLEGTPRGLLLSLTRGNAGEITSMAVFGPTIYFGRAGGNYTTMDINEVFAGGDTTRKLFLEYDGLLYGAWQNELYYTNDGVTWSDAFQVGGADVEIRGMAGMGDSLYMATDKALYRFAPGEVVEEVARFGSESPTNGAGMIEYQGALYIPSAGRVFRYDQSGQMMDVWVGRGGDLPAERLGRVVRLTRTNNWLLAVVVPSNAVGDASIWAFQEEGWHYLTNAGPAKSSIVDGEYQLYYDRGTRRLWFTYPDCTPNFVTIPDYAFDPFNLPGYRYMPFGWIEQDRFFGGQYLLPKSWESVTVVGDIASASKVDVYFQDEGSTVWEILGTIDTDGEELRWEDYNIRPAGKWVKIGLRLNASVPTVTPRIRAVIVKFLPYPNDRISDSVTLMLGDVQMPDGAPVSASLATQWAHIESLIASVDPIIYQDPFGTKYEVTITAWRMTAPRFRHDGVSELRVSLVLEQLPRTTYTS